MNQELKDLIELIEKVETRINAYWSFYTLVVIGIGGWLFAKASGFSVAEALIVSVAYGVFSLANLSIIGSATRLAVALSDELRMVSANSVVKSNSLMSVLGSELLPHRMAVTRTLHYSVDMAIFIAIWYKALFI